jgi:phage terminase large subunit
MISEIRAKGLDPKYPNYWALPEPMTLYENPYISQEEKDVWIEMLSEKSQRSRVYGYATSQEGLVYEEFSEKTHVCDPFPIPDDWRFYRCIDFGGEHPTTSIIMATDGYYIYVIAEYYQSHRLVEYHVAQMRHQEKEIVLKSGTSLIPNLITITDHDLQLRMQYENLGIYSSPAKKDRIAGCETVRNLLKIHSDGHVRLKVFRHCKNTIREFQLYHLPGENRKGRLLPGEKADDPVKEYDDCLDPVRYGCVEEFGYFEEAMLKIISVR